MIAAHDAGVDVSGGSLQLADGILGRALRVFEDRGALYMTRDDTDLPVRPAAYDDATTPSGWALAFQAHRRLRPDDTARWMELFRPLGAFALHAPRSAGSALSRAVERLWPDG